MDQIAIVKERVRREEWADRIRRCSSSSNTTNGAQASALIYSLAVTACANGLNVEDYFYRLLISDDPVLPWNE